PRRGLHRRKRPLRPASATWRRAPPRSAARSQARLRARLRARLPARAQPRPPPRPPSKIQPAKAPLARHEGGHLACKPGLGYKIGMMSHRSIRVMLLACCTVLVAGGAIAQTKGTLEPKPLPPIANP